MYMYIYIYIYSLLSYIDIDIDIDIYRERDSTHVSPTACPLAELGAAPFANGRRIGLKALGKKQNKDT